MASLEDSMLSSDDAGCSSNKDEEVFIKHIREYDNFRSFIDNDELKAEEIDSLRRLNRYIKNHFKEWKDKELVVGVTGRTGSGKSSLTNKLRGINSKVKGAAAVGVTETTRDITSYKYPGNDYIILRDFPGFGTTSYPKEEYLQQTKILDSSVVIIVSCARFSEDDVWIAQKAIAVQRNVLFVRSKIDQDIENAEEEDPDFSENTCMAKIKEEIKINLIRSDLDPQLYHDIFLVSSRLSKTYDILSLHEKIKALPIMKAEAICHFLFEHMKKAIADKTETIKTEFLGRKVASVFTGFLPIPKLESTTDTHHVKKIFEECEVKYCVDRDSISEFAREINMSESEIEIEIESRMKSRDDRVRDEYKLYTETEDKKWAFVQKYSKYTFPVLGMLYSAYKSPRTIQECLDKICDAMAEDELMLVKLRLRKLEKDLKM